MDMIGRTKGPGFTDPDPTHVLVNPREVMVVGPNISSDDLEKTIETVNSAYQKLTLNHFYDTTAPDATHDNLGRNQTASVSFIEAITTILRELAFQSHSLPPVCTRTIIAQPTRRRRSTSRRCR